MDHQALRGTTYRQTNGCWCSDPTRKRPTRQLATKDRDGSFAAASAVLLAGAAQYAEHEKSRQTALAETMAGPPIPKSSP